MSSDSDNNNNKNDENSKNGDSSNLKKEEANDSSSPNNTTTTDSKTTTTSNDEISNNTNAKEITKDDKKFQLRIAVGSTNPCKIDAVRHAIQQAIGLSSSLDVDLDIQGFSVESGVPDQPFGDEETQYGAKERAQNAYKAYKKKYNEFPHLSIGLEGGLEFSKTILDEKNDETLWCMAWIAIYGKRKSMIVDLIASNQCKVYEGDKKPIFGVAKTGTFLLPMEITKLVIDDGLELGDADDKLFNRTKSKHGSGTVGILTDNLITRSDYYIHAILLALVPWIRPDVYSFSSNNKSSFSTTQGISSLFCNLTG